MAAAVCLGGLEARVKGEGEDTAAAAASRAATTAFGGRPILLRTPSGVPDRDPIVFPDRPSSLTACFRP